MLLEKLLELLKGWVPAFPQRRTGGRAIALAVGLLCGLGRRTLTRAICFNRRQHQDWSADYKLFNRSRWQTRALFAPVIQTQPGQILPPTDRHRLRRHAAQTLGQESQNRL